jgi:hypothetical protein
MYDQTSLTSAQLVVKVKYVCFIVQYAVSISNIDYAYWQAS